MYYACYAAERTPELRSDDPLTDPRWLTTAEIAQLSTDPEDLAELVRAALGEADRVTSAAGSSP